MESKRKFWKGKGKGKESFPKTPKRNRKGKLSHAMSGKGKGMLSMNYRKVSTTASKRVKGRLGLKIPNLSITFGVFRVGLEKWAKIVLNSVSIISPF